MKANGKGKSLFASQAAVPHQGKPKKTAKTGTESESLEERCSPAPFSAAFSHTAQAHVPRDDTAHSVLGLSASMSS